MKLSLVRASAHVFWVRLVCSMLGMHPVVCAVAHSSMRMAEHGHFLVLWLSIENALPWLSVSMGMCRLTVLWLLFVVDALVRCRNRMSVPYSSRAAILCCGVVLSNAHGCVVGVGFMWNHHVFCCRMGSSCSCCAIHPPMVAVVLSALASEAPIQLEICGVPFCGRGVAW